MTIFYFSTGDNPRGWGGGIKVLAGLCAIAWFVIRLLGI